MWFYVLQYLAPLTWAASGSRAARSSALSWTSSETAFPSIHFTRLVPGIGTTGMPSLPLWAAVHAMAICPAVTRLASAIFLTVSAMAWLAVAASSPNRASRRRPSPFARAVASTAPALANYPG